MPLFFYNQGEMSNGEYRLRAGGNSPTWLKPVALLPLDGSFFVYPFTPQHTPGERIQ
jgi:hypothetical protein